jgi:hypothetical protein
MFTYAGVRLGTRAYEGLGNSPQAARRLGFWTALGTMTAVEIADGYTKKWRFSREDLVMDLAGAGLGWLLETRPELDALIDLRLHYRRSRVAGVQQKFDPFGDYSGQTYVLAFKAAGLPALRRHAVARYLELVVGYRAHGFEAEAAVAGARSRHVYVGLALNLSELLRASVFAGSSAPSRTQRVSETVLEFVQVPGTAAAARHEF